MVLGAATASHTPRINVHVEVIRYHDHHLARPCAHYDCYHYKLLSVIVVIVSVPIKFVTSMVTVITLVIVEFMPLASLRCGHANRLKLLTGPGHRLLPKP